MKPEENWDNRKCQFAKKVGRGCNKGTHFGFVNAFNNGDSEMCLTPFLFLVLAGWFQTVNAALLGD